ncbi:alpha/beta hydrolase family protein [Candidatus Leptofilum sp.]|uniref:alpha/beta hydrolase family protein n=1 Tax=Candidatus Leptofilum sp. TaxID=3241576 RepID=UPI003B5AA30F
MSKQIEPAIDSLRQLSIDGLRSRKFRATLTIETQLGDPAGSSEYAQFYGAPYYHSYLLSYRSDGLRVYSRLDLPPVDMPANGYPVIIFAHGWVSASDAPSYAFAYQQNAYYGDILDSYVKAGFAVLTPGFRGHGTVNGCPADGLAYMQAYDNGSYLIPLFNAIDILNLLEGVGSLNQVNWRAWGANNVKIDSSRIYITGHSKGGDAALAALAVASSGTLNNQFKAASIWCGSIEGRIEQGAFYGAQEASREALTDPAYFPFMPPTWQTDDYWGTIEAGLAQKKRQLYDTVKRYVRDQADADSDTNSLVEVMASLDAAKHLQYVDVPLDLHYSDRDHFSVPAWNASIIRLLRAVGGSGNAYLYRGNSHDLRVVPGWSPAGAVSGRATAVSRTIARFQSN